MPDVSQYDFSFQEVAAALIKTAGITSGKWSVGVNFVFNVGTMGQSPEGALPSVMMQIQSVNMAKVPDDAPVGGTIIDAATVG